MGHPSNRTRKMKRDATLGPRIHPRLPATVETMTAQTTMMEQQQESTATLPAETRPRLAPFWNVILLDDDDHTYDYVIEMLGKVFGHGLETAYQMASEVDTTGRVIVDTTTLERAELKRDQIHAYGRDWRLERSAGSMSAVIEPAV